MPEYHNQEKVAEQINKLFLDLGWKDVEAIGNKNNGNVDVHIPGDKNKVIEAANIIGDQGFGDLVIGDGVHNNGTIFINGDDAGIHADLIIVDVFPDSLSRGVTSIKKDTAPKYGPGDINALNSKAQELLSAGNYMEALDVCAEVLIIDRNNEIALRNMNIAFSHVP